MEVFKVFSLDRILQLAEQIIEDDIFGKAGFQQRVVEQKLRGVGLVAPFSDVMQLLDVFALFSPGNLYIRPRVHATALRLLE